MARRDAETGEVLVDARGHRCPTPTLRLGRAVRSAPPGCVLRLLADDPLARIDVANYAREAGLEMLGVEAAGEALSIRVRVPAREQRRAVRGNGAPPED